jgi:outer membrane protein insertion porin family
VRDLNPKAGASAAIIAEKGETTLSEMSTSINIDTTNNALIPSEGYNFSFSSSYAGLGGDKDFIRVINTGNYYQSYNDELIIFELGYEAGVIMGLSQDILISDRFFLGGNNFRGFEQSGIGPRDSVSNDSLGGNLYYTGSLKSTFGLGLPPELGIRGNWFATLGSLTGIDNSSLNFKDNSSIRMSTGLGISWNSPFGPISVILSQALLKEDYDITESVSFGIGTKF